MENIEELISKIQSWRDKSDKNSVFCLFGDQNRKDGYLYSSAVGGCQRTIAHMVYTEMKRDSSIAEAVKKAVEVYNQEQCK